MKNDDSNVPKGVNDFEGTWKTGEYEQVSTPVTVYENEPKYLINASYFTFIIKQIEGQILTIADACTEDDRKREALKSLLRQSLWSEAKEVRLLRLQKV